MSEELLNCPFSKNSMELQILKAEKLCDNWDDCKRKGNRLYVRNINGNYIHLTTYNKDKL